MDNVFFYCRTHKKECESQNTCSPAHTTIDLLFEDVKEGDVMTCTKTPPIGNFLLHYNYIAYASSSDICIRDEDGTEFQVSNSQKCWEYFTPLRR